MQRGVAIIGVLMLVLAAGGACGDDGGGGGGNPDAATNGPDADPNAPDADPNAPDADPNAPDADPGAPDAATTCSNDLTLCGGECVDLATDDDFCGNCATSCTAQGKSCVLGSCASGVGSLVLSELHAAQPAFYELYNGGASAIDLAGYLIQWTTNSGGSGSVVLPSYSLAPDSYVILREGSGTDGDGVVFLGQSIGWTTGVAVRLLEPLGVGIDFVRTGTSTVDPPAGTAWTGGNAANPGATVDQSLVRNVYVADTDTAADWTLSAVQSPGEYCGIPGRCGDACYDFSADRDNCGSCGFTCSGSQLCVDGGCVAGRSVPWLSEYRRFPRAMVEVHNPTASAVVMTGYRIDISGADNLSYTFPTFTLQPGAFVAVYMGTGTDDAVSLYAGASKAFAGDIAIALYDDSSTALDFVRFGSSGEPAPAAAPWFGSNVAAVSANADIAARRDLEKLDTDSDADWKAVSPGTPGFACFAGLTQCSGECRDTQSDPEACGGCGTSCSANESCVSGTCRSVGKVVISEIRNSSTEAIELYNGGDTAVDLEGWQLGWSGDNVSSYTIGAGVTIDPGGFLYFYEGSGSSTSTIIYTGATISWTDFIAVSLSDDGDNEKDFVRTGSSVTTGSWSGNNAPNPTASLHRYIYRDDTDTAADWYEDAVSPALACASDEAACGESCVNLDQDADNCGRCGNTCGAGGQCYLGQCVADGALRLGYVYSGDGTYDGRVEVYLAPEWRVVYSVNAASQNVWADVVCKQMGFYSGSWYSTSQYGTCPGNCGYISSVTCTGDEARLLDCTYSSGSSQQKGVRVECNVAP